MQIGLVWLSFNFDWIWENTCSGFMSALAEFGEQHCINWLSIFFNLKSKGNVNSQNYI